MSDLDSVSRLLGQLEGKIDANAQDLHEQAIILATLREQYTDLHVCLQGLRNQMVIHEKQSAQLAEAAEDYKKPKQRAIGILFVAGMIFAALWEGFKLAFKKWGG